MVDVHRLGDDVVNFYLIREGTDITMVDAGLPAHYRRLTACLAEFGRSVRDIRAVILTHTHLDHLGLAERIRREAGASVLASDQDAPALARPSRTDPASTPQSSLPRYLVRHPGAFRLPLHLATRGAFGTRPVSEFRTIAGASGSTLDVPGRPTVVWVPGHTAGSVAFHLPEQGVVFSGDALVTSDGILGRTGPRIVCAAFTHSTSQALASLSALARLDADTVFAGHGEPFTGGVRAAVAAATAEGAS